MSFLMPGQNFFLPYSKDFFCGDFFAKSSIKGFTENLPRSMLETVKWREKGTSANPD